MPRPPPCGRAQQAPRRRRGWSPPLPAASSPPSPRCPSSVAVAGRHWLHGRPHCMRLLTPPRSSEPQISGPLPAWVQEPVAVYIIWFTCKLTWLCLPSVLLHSEHGDIRESLHLAKAPDIKVASSAIVCQAPHLCRIARRHLVEITIPACGFSSCQRRVPSNLEPYFGKQLSG